MALTGGKKQKDDNKSKTEKLEKIKTNG